MLASLKLASTAQGVSATASLLPLTAADSRTCPDSLHDLLERYAIYALSHVTAAEQLMNGTLSADE